MTFVVRALDTQHDRSAFRSGVEALDRWFLEQAGQSQRKRRTTVWVISQAARVNVPLGYYSLAPFHLTFEECPETLRRRLPPAPVYVALIARLAVDRGAQGQKLGHRLLADAIERAYGASLAVPTHAVVVHAKNDRAAGFYRLFGFQPFPDAPHHLFLPMTAVAALTQGTATD